MNEILGKDSKGRLIRVGDQVIVPEPEGNEDWFIGNFVGTAKGDKQGPLIQIEDYEGNVWDVEPERVTIEENLYPIYCRQDIENLPEGLYLALFHGYASEEERTENEDWGENGPVIGPIEYCQTTYSTHIKIKFTKDEDSKKYNLPAEVVTELSLNKDGCVEYGGLQYGDYTVFYHKNL